MEMDSAVLKIELMHADEDSETQLEKSQERIITATKNSTHNIRTNKKNNQN